MPSRSTCEEDRSCLVPSRSTWGVGRSRLVPNRSTCEEDRSCLVPSRSTWGVGRSRLVSIRSTFDDFIYISLSKIKMVTKKERGQSVEKYMA
ncbi:hypothetical protein ACIQ2D_13585 [Lysinibacillus sp. NPDC097287]|uniref:hypothetical protein n=1 Tax=Lysinibacillus sp. NPDC097287 TaxID=3364144 RepID=UPI0038212218